KCSSIAEAEDAAGRLAWPVVVKPTDNAGSRGVSLASGESELIDSFRAAQKCSRSGFVLVEEFMPGVEISCEAFVYQGQVFVLGLSDKIRTAPPHLLDTTVLFPSEQPAAIQVEAREVAKKAILAAGIDMATVHMELMVSDGRVRIVELAA